MRAYRTTSDYKLELHRKARPKPKGGELLLKVLRAGICGTDLHGSNLYEPGTILGHEFVGQIEEVGPDVGDFRVGQIICSVPAIGCGHCKWCVHGDPIHCRDRSVLETAGGGAFADYVLVSAASSVVVPPNVDLNTAALVEPLAIGLKAVDRAQIEPGDRVLIIGAGPVGAAVTLWAARTLASEITVSDPHENHRALALRLGADRAISPGDVVAEAANPPDVVFECAGRTGLIAQATSIVSAYGRVIVVGLSPEPEYLNRLPLLQKEIRLDFPNFANVRLFRTVLNTIAWRNVNVAPLLEEVILPSELPAHFERMKVSNPHGKILVDFSSQDVEGRGRE